MAAFSEPDRRRSTWIQFHAIQTAPISGETLPPFVEARYAVYRGSLVPLEMSARECIYATIRQRDRLTKFQCVCNAPLQTLLASKVPSIRMEIPLSLVSSTSTNHNSGAEVLWRIGSVALVGILWIFHMPADCVKLHASWSFVMLFVLE